MRKYYSALGLLIINLSTFAQQVQKELGTMPEKQSPFIRNNTTPL